MGRKGTKNNGITVGRHIFYQTFTEVQSWRVQEGKNTEQSFLFWWKHKLTLIFTNSCNVEMSGRRLFFWTDTQPSCVCVSLWFRQSTSLAFLNRGFGLSTNKRTFTITAMSRTTILETSPPLIYLFMFCFCFVFFLHRFMTKLRDDPAAVKCLFCRAASIVGKALNFPKGFRLNKSFGVDRRWSAAVESGPEVHGCRARQKMLDFGE